ncbi:MAG: hypothetical protein OEM81_03635 [Acidimicrobiia bacterium]|nr:hypothetical protein [Acidimicrobiia bacterium]MDH5615260.1 hypothetical protein [Acidimicrobiia bacterium]
MHRKYLLFCLLGLMALVLAACSTTGEPGPAGPAGPAGPGGPAGPAGDAASVSAADLTCTECHNDTTLIVSKEAQFRERSVHGTGEAFERGESTSCAGCHGSEGAEARIEAGLLPHDPSVEGVTNVSPYSCRTCHDIHTTYTRADFSLTGDAAPAQMENTEGTFDGGFGNLCANCHQIRNELPAASGGEITFESNRFGTHHGVEAQMLLGEGGLMVSGSPSVHYGVENTCVTCHMGENRNHTYEPDVEYCQACHADLDTLDRNGVQTEIQTMLDEVRELLISAGIIDLELDPEGNRSVPGTYPEEVASAMWNYMFVLEDQSRGVHNPPFAKALLEQAKTALGG